MIIMTTIAEAVTQSVVYQRDIIDSRIDRLEEEVQRSSYDLKSAEERLRDARAELAVLNAWLVENKYDDDNS